MAKHIAMGVAGLTYLNTCAIDTNNYKIHINKPVTFIDLHRELMDAFDDYELIVFPTPTMRITDKVGEIQPPWNIDVDKIIGDITYNGVMYCRHS